MLDHPSMREERATDRGSHYSHSAVREKWGIMECRFVKEWGICLGNLSELTKGRNGSSANPRKTATPRQIFEDNNRLHYIPIQNYTIYPYKIPVGHSADQAHFQSKN